MDKQFDLVVVGTGVASAAASKCREAGWTVAVIDCRPFGGTCALRGCRPKKLLVSAGEALNAARDMGGKGVRAPNLSIDWPELMRFKRSETDPAPQVFAEGYARQGIEALRGQARFVGPTALALNGDQLIGRHVLIAAGAKPAPLPFPGAEHLMASDGFLDLDTLPRRIVFVGGGYISFEFAHVAARAGADVTIIHRGARPLEGFDPDLVDLLVTRTRGLGIRSSSRRRCAGSSAPTRGVVVHGSGDGGDRRFEADIAVHGAGRIPDLDDLDLERAGVTRERRGVTVNQYLQSVSNPAVYASGDAAASGPPLTPKAGQDSEVVAAEPPGGQPSDARLSRDRQRRLHGARARRGGPHRGDRARPGPQISLALGGHLLVALVAARGRDGVGLQGAGGRGDRACPGRPPPGSARRRGDQPLRPRHPLRHSRQRAEEGSLRVPHQRVRHPLHGVRRRRC